MRNTIIAVVAAASILFAAPSQAAGKSSRQENIGVGSGAVIGALAGGPVGLVIGAALGALIFGVVQQGLFFANVESSLFRVFLGVILLLAVILNTYIRRLITGER